MNLNNAHGIVLIVSIKALLIFKLRFIFFKPEKSDSLQEKSTQSDHFHC